MSNTLIDPGMGAQAMTDQEMVRHKQQITALQKELGNTQSKEEKLRVACEGFESIFIQKMWEQMRSSLPKGGYMHSRDEETYQSMFDQEFSKKMASAGGIGLGDMLYEQLSMKLGDSGRTTSPSTLHDRIPMEPVRMGVLQPAPARDNSALANEATTAVKAVGDAVKAGQKREAELYAPLNEALEEVTGLAEENSRINFVEAALADFAAQVKLGAVAHSKEALQATREAVLSGKDLTQPWQASAVGRVPSPRNSVEGARPSISPHERVRADNATDADAKAEARILSQAQAVANKGKTSGKASGRNARAVKPANYVSTPIPASVPAAFGAESILPTMSTEGVAIIQPPSNIPAPSVSSQNLGRASDAPAVYGRTGLIAPPQGAATIMPQVIPRTALPLSSQMPPQTSQAPAQNAPAGTSSRQTSSATQGTGQKASAPQVSSLPTDLSQALAMLNDHETSNSGAAQWPVQGQISSEFGWLENSSGQKVWNPGVEIASADNLAVRAFMNGMVAFAGEHEDYGDLVVLEHADGLKSYYGNAKAKGLKPGDLVKVGTEIASLNASASNLRFETRRGELALNPANFLPELTS